MGEEAQGSHCGACVAEEGGRRGLLDVVQNLPAAVEVLHRGRARDPLPQAQLLCIMGVRVRMCVFVCVWVCVCV